MKEETLHRQICNYLHHQYPKVIFNTDLSGIKLSMYQATKVRDLRSGRGFPDIMIYERSGNFGALFIELKTSSPFRKDGKLKAGQHLAEQWDMLQRLHKRKYKAVFAWSFDQAKEIIDNYLKNRI